MFTRHDYHGTVIWSWQQALFAAGLARQLERHDLPPRLRAGLVAAQHTLWSAIEATHAVANSELWSWSYAGGSLPRESVRLLLGGCDGVRRRPALEHRVPRREASGLRGAAGGGEVTCRERRWRVLARLAWALAAAALVPLAAALVQPAAAARAATDSSFLLRAQRRRPAVLFPGAARQRLHHDPDRSARNRADADLPRRAHGLHPGGYLPAGAGARMGRSRLQPRPDRVGAWLARSGAHERGPLRRLSTDPRSPRRHADHATIGSRIAVVTRS